MLRPSHKHPCIEGWPAAVFQRCRRRSIGSTSSATMHDDLTTALYADALPVEPDKEGRIVLPESLVPMLG